MRRPVHPLIESRLFAQASSPSGARFGIAAPEAVANGVAESEATNTSAIIAAGALIGMSATKQAAATRAETIMIRRRSWRSARAPKNGLSRPFNPKVSKNRAESHSAQLPLALVGAGRKPHLTWSNGCCAAIRNGFRRFRNASRLLIPRTAVS